MDTPWTKIAGGAALGAFVVSAVPVGFQIWDRSKGANVSGGWILTVSLVCMIAAGGLFVIGAFISTRKRDSSTALQRQQSAVQAESRFVCPYEWVHEIAQAQAREIRQWIKLQRTLFADVDLFRQRPYLEVRFVVYNASLYRVSLTELSGVVLYANVSMDAELRWIGSYLTLNAGDTRDGVIRITLKDKEDVLRMLNIQSGFSFERLWARLTTEPSTPEKEFSFVSPLGDEFIRQKYPKLKIEILESNLCPYSNFDKSWEPGQLMGTIVNLRVRLDNDRERPVDVRRFMLLAMNDSTTTNAEEGDIYEVVDIYNEAVRHGGPKLENLNRAPSVQRGRTEEGWLQFLVLGKGPTKLDTPISFGNLVVVDDFGEEHIIGVPPFKWRESMV